MTEIRRVLIWSGWLRVSHWSIVLSTLVLLVTGWLIGHSVMLAIVALEYHYLAVSVLIFGLIIRLIIFVKGKPHERLSALFPDVTQMKAIRQTLVFYLSLSKQPLPHWYAHNPLWKIIYIFWYVALLLLLASGMQMTDAPVIMGFYPPSVHLFWADVILWLVLLHLVTLFMHDYYGKTTDVSAMINGYRLFEVEGKAKENLRGTPVVLQSMDSLMKRGKE